MRPYTKEQQIIRRRNARYEIQDLLKTLLVATLLFVGLEWASRQWVNKHEVWGFSLVLAGYGVHLFYPVNREVSFNRALGRFSKSWTCFVILLNVPDTLQAFQYGGFSAVWAMYSNIAKPIAILMFLLPAFGASFWMKRRYAARLKELERRLSQ